MSRSKLNYKVYNGKSIKKIFENSRCYILALLFALGIIIGAISINADNTIINNISNIIDSYTLVKAGQGITENFLNSLTVNLLFIFINIFFSFSLIGVWGEGSLFLLTPAPAP